MRVVWTGPAVRDLNRHARYVMQFNPTAARQLVQRLMKLAGSLTIFPNRAKPTFGGIRELALISPYVLTYKVEGDVIRILRVWHGAQDRDMTDADHDQED